jgi:glutaminyl-tRNA synthetase
MNAPKKAAADISADHKPSNFLRAIVERDLEKGTYAGRHFAGSPGDARHHAAGPLDPARIRTRFPPEPNGYLHIGHAKSICLNFGLAEDYGGACHMRFDDTNPEKEDQEYVDSIVDAVQWLGYSWTAFGVEHLYHASDYFDFMARAAEHLISVGLAYVDEQSAEEMRANRGTLTEPGRPSPFRDRAAAENLLRFQEMRDGKHADGAMVVRAKIDMASPNLNLRDPAIYRIKHAEHHRTGNDWCIYPMYTFAHPIEDALEQITHSLCTLEFEDQRPFYDWVLDRLAEGGLLPTPHPRQYEFARLNLTYVVTSKRKLKQLVDEGIVDGWDDPRMPTVVGLRRRGYTPSSLRLFAERIGVSKSDSWIDYATLEIALRDDLDPKAPRAMAVLDPLKLVLVNWREAMAGRATDPCEAPVHPAQPERGKRSFNLGPELWIERDDFVETPPKGFFRLYPGNRVRLRYGVVVECTGCQKDAAGNIVSVQANIVPDTKSGTPGADVVKVKGAITWVGAHDAQPAEFRLYDRLFTQAQPDANGNDFKASLNAASKQVLRGFVEPSMAQAHPGEAYQFERHGYYVADTKDHSRATPVFNRTATLKDTWR